MQLFQVANILLSTLKNIYKKNKKIYKGKI